MSYLKYFLLVLISIPFLPIMYFQGKRIKSSVPDLPEAKGTQGLIKKTGTPFNLICMGESTIAGVGVKTHSEGFAGSFAEFLGTELNRTINWKVIAKSGYNTRQVYQELVPKVLNVKADLLVVGIGANDAFELNFPWRFQKDIALLIKKLRASFPSTPIVFLNMPPIKDFPAFTLLIQFVLGNLVDIHGEFLRKEVSKHENVFFNDEKITLENWSHRLPGNLEPIDFFSDGVHPSKLTYQIWGQETGRFVLKNNIIKI